MTFATLETIDNYDNIDDQFNDQEDEKKKKKNVGGQQDLLYLKIYLPGSLEPECLKCFY